jgi:hypothetical protein
MQAALRIPVAKRLEQLRERYLQLQEEAQAAAAAAAAAAGDSSTCSNDVLVAPVNMGPMR